MAKILVIDDCNIMRELLALQLASAGHDVDKASDVVSGGHAVLSARPDLIVSDVDMPVVDGFQLIAALRENGAGLGIPVIFVSSNPTREPGAMVLGAAAFLSKPVSVDRLLSCVAASLPAK